MKKKSIAIKLIAVCAGFMPATWSFGQQTPPKLPDRAIQMVVPFSPGGTTIYKARAQAAITPLAYRSGDQFKSFALAEYEKFKQVVKQHNLQEK